MIGVDELSSMPKEHYEDLKRRRVQLLNMYCTEDGARVLMNMMRNSRVFDVVDPKDEALNGARNFVVCLLQEIGLFDEDYIFRCILGRQNHSVLPERDGDDGYEGGMLTMEVSDGS